jgi:gliding motility-associated-like protein
VNFAGSTPTPVINNASINNSGKYYVKVTSDKGCINIDSTTVVINKNSAANAGTDTVICEGTSIKLQGSGINATNYLWSPNTALSSRNIPNPVASPASTTSYILTVTNGTCKSSDTVIINVIKKPTVDAGPNQRMMMGDSAVLNGSVTGSNITYYWTPAFRMKGSTTLRPVVEPPFDVTYTLNVVSSNGCSTATDTVRVRVFKKIEFANAFSPNNDGINDKWNIEGLQTYPFAEVSIFNRYGQVVFYNKGFLKLWNGLYNGRPLPVGTYYYIIDLKEGLPKYSGSIVLLR